MHRKKQAKHLQEESQKVSKSKEKSKGGEDAKEGKALEGGSVNMQERGMFYTDILSVFRFYVCVYV